MSFVAPKSGVKAFTCPHCGVLARQQQWGYGNTHPLNPTPEEHVTSVPIRVSRCEHCGQNCLWWMDSLVYPDKGNAASPNRDMPADVRMDYEEAARIYTKSPRGAAALLRLAIQKLMVHLGESGRNINDDIASLVRKGLPIQVQQALDIVRVTGNNAVHPGQIDANDIGVAEQLFPLVNVIVESQISLPARIRDMYSALPDSAKAAIERRDGG